MAMILTTLFVSAVLVWIYMTGWYFLSIIQKRNDIADIAWGLGFIVIAFLNLLINPSFKLLISATLILIWGSRLALHIYQRNKNKKEDKRYLQFKKSPYVRVFLTQGLLMWLISWPVINSAGTLKWFNLIGVLIWAIGFYFESRSDRELQEFKSDPKNKGKVLQSGLWAYSRHPNYFGEVTMWWGIWLLNLSPIWWTIVGPITITYLILKVSGIPLLEKRYQGNPEFEEYKKKVSIFIPWFPKK
jgi:steroid 5-alpha reductase family enzyme